MKISKALSAVTAAAMLLTLTACSNGSSGSTPLDDFNSDYSEASPEDSYSEIMSSPDSTSSEDNEETEPNLALTAEETPARDFQYEEIRDIGIEITGYNGDNTIVKIPSEIDGKKVVKIGNEAFKYRSDITDIAIPEGVTEVTPMAFSRCSGLRNVALPDSVMSIGAVVGFGDYLGTYAKFTYRGKEYRPSQYDELNDAITSNPGLTADAALANGFKFEYSEELGGMIITDYIISHATNVEIPSAIDGISVVGIEGNYYMPEYYQGAFAQCYDLTSVTIPYGVKRIGYSSFQRRTKLTEVIIPDSVTEIGDFAFAQCDKLKNITLPNSVTKIEKGSFAACYATITYKGKTYTSDNYDALYNAVNSISLTVAAPVSTESPVSTQSPVSTESPVSHESPASDFEYEYKEELGGIVITKYTGSKSVVNIPSEIDKKKVVKLNIGSFGNSNITEVTIPYGVIEIGDSAFGECSSLKSVDIPNGVTKIGVGAFMSCTALTSITIPNSITRILDQTFFDCTSLKNVAIPDSVTFISSGNMMFGPAFYGCNANVTYKGKTYSPDNYDALYNAANSNSSNDAAPESPASDFEYKYKEELGGIVITKYIGSDSDVYIPEKINGQKVVRIAMFTFAFFNGTSITIPDSVTEIEFDAFMGSMAKIIYKGETISNGYYLPLYNA